MKRFRGFSRGFWISAAALFAGAVVLILFPPFFVSPRPAAMVGARVRANTQALVVYAQQHDDEFPPPDRAIALLTASGSVAAAVFEPPTTKKGEAAFLVVLQEDPKAKWSNSFRAAEPLVIANPAVWGDKAGTIGFADGHPEVIQGDELSKLLEQLRPRLAPLR